MSTQAGLFALFCLFAVVMIAYDVYDTRAIEKRRTKKAGKRG